MLTTTTIDRKPPDEKPKRKPDKHRAITLADRMLRLPTVLQVTGLGRDTVYRKSNDADDDFPKPREISKHCIAWLESEILAWMATRPVSAIRSPNPDADRQAPVRPRRKSAGA